MKKAKSIGKLVKALFEHKTIYIYSDSFSYCLKFHYPTFKYNLINENIADSGKYLTISEFFGDFIFNQIVNDRMNFKIENSKDIL